MVVNVPNIIKLINDKFSASKVRATKEPSVQDVKISETIIELLKTAQEDEYFETDECLEFDEGYFLSETMCYHLNIVCTIEIYSSNDPDFFLQLRQIMIRAKATMNLSMKKIVRVTNMNQIRKKK